MADLHISWDEYNKKTEQLAVQVHKDGWDFNQVVCIAKGGMRVGDIMARIFNVPLAVLSVESYRGDGVKNKRGSITFSRDLAKTSPNIGSKVLIVDDLIATGGTAKALASLIAQCWNVPKENILVLAVIDLPDLGGSAIIEQEGFNVETLIEFEGE